MGTAMAMAFAVGDKLKELLREASSINPDYAQQQQEISSGFESVLHKMFGSCTTGGGDIKCDVETASAASPSGCGSPEQPRSTDRSSRTKKPTSPDRGSGRQQDYVESIYEHLFTEDAPRRPSPRAPDSARDQEPRDSNTHATTPRFNMQTGTKQIYAGIASQQPPLTPLGTSELYIPTNKDFDDTISAVSAFTLEALAQAEKLKRSPSNDSSLFPSSSRDTPTRQSPSVATPSQLSRWVYASPRVPHRHSSQQTRETRNIESSNSDDQSVEHNQWISTEREFWQQEAQLPPLKPTQPKSVMSRKTNDLTESTISCSHSSLAPQQTHEPWDAPNALSSEPLDATSTALARDPDRIIQVLVMPEDAELAEI